MERARSNSSRSCGRSSAERGAADQERRRSERPRPRRGFARHRLPLVAAPQGRTGRQHGARLQVAARSRAAPTSGDHVTAELDARRVDDFRQQLVGRGLSPRSVNMVLDLLAQILDDAVEYGLLDANPARGRRRRMKVPKSSRTFLEPDMVVDLLDAAGAWEAGAAGASALRPPRLPRHAMPWRSADQRADRAPDRGRLDLHAGQVAMPGRQDRGRIERTLSFGIHCSTSCAPIWRPSRPPRDPTAPARRCSRPGPADT